MGLYHLYRMYRFRVDVEAVHCDGLEPRDSESGHLAIKGKVAYLQGAGKGGGGGVKGGWRDRRRG